ncbi:MAG: Rab family GTPase [Candidatus Hodarchaeota archaeon]
MVEEEILKGVVYSKFEDIGPSPMAWFPLEIKSDTLRLISLKSITLLTGEEGEVPETTAVVPFPNLERSGLVKYLEIEDPQARGGRRDASVTILFDDKYNSVIYKYMNVLNERLNDFSKKVNQFEKVENKSQFTKELKDFYSEILDLLKELRLSEEREQFPAPKLVVSPPKTKYRFKVIVVGDPAVGKTTLILRFVDRAFKKLYVPTIGVQTSTKLVKLGGPQEIFIELIIWDIAGQEKFNQLRKMFYSGADGVIFVFDVTNKQTFVNTASWFKDVQQNLDRDWKGIILANKIDLKNSRVIGPKAGQVIADKTGLDYLETSARTGENIDLIFQLLSKKILETKK